MFSCKYFAPQDWRKKKEVRDFIFSFISSSVGEFLLFGDFKVVCRHNEKSWSIFCQANDFNYFIVNSYLTDNHMGGRRFTRVDRLCSKMAKLDHFLVTNGVFNIFPDLVGTVLPHMWSNQALIVLKNQHVDYGPIPFKLFHAWFEMEGFEQIVLDAWN